MSGVTQDVDRDDIPRSGGDSGTSRVRKLAVLHTKTPTAEGGSLPRPQTTTRLSKAISRRSIDQEAEVRAIEEMQGKFEVRGGRMDPTSSAGTGAEVIFVRSGSPVTDTAYRFSPFSPSRTASQRGYKDWDVPDRQEQFPPAGQTATTLPIGLAIQTQRISCAWLHADFRQLTH